MKSLMVFSEDVIALNPELGRQISAKIKEPRRSKPVAGGYDSVLELDYDTELTARGWPHVLHPFTYHLPGGVDYTPDFVAWYVTPVGIVQTCVIEVKGSNSAKNARDSRTRFRIAAGLHPYAIFLWVVRAKSGEWIEKVYKP